MNLAISLLPMILLFWWLNRYIGKKMQNMGGANSMLFGGGKSGAKQYVVDDKTGIKFQDVAGEDEAKESLPRSLTSAQPPEIRGNRRQDAQGRVAGRPSGHRQNAAGPGRGRRGRRAVLLHRRQRFVEMFVGMGASKVRDLFKQAAEKAPCIVFIDEIDTIGKKRDGASGLGGNDEREQTLNQLLTEMDGFDATKGVSFWPLPTVPNRWTRPCSVPAVLTAAYPWSCPT